MNVSDIRFVKGSKKAKLGEYQDRVLEWKINGKWLKVGMLDVGLERLKYKDNEPAWLKDSVDFLRANENGLYPKPKYLGSDYLDSFLKQMMDNSGPKFLDILCRNFKLDIRKTIYHRMVK